MKNSSWCAIAILLVLSPSCRPQDAASDLPSGECQNLEGLSEAKRHALWTRETRHKIDSQIRRYDQLLDRWEEQTKRFEVLIAKWERSESVTHSQTTLPAGKRPEE